jgi:hypothetical protein
MEELATSSSDAAGDGALLSEDSAVEDAAVDEWAGVEGAEWDGLWEVGADRVERSSAGEAREAGVGTRGGLVGQYIEGRTVQHAWAWGPGRRRRSGQHLKKTWRRAATR